MGARSSWQTEQRYTGRMLEEQKVTALLRELAKGFYSLQRDAIALEQALVEAGIITPAQLMVARGSVDERLGQTSERIRSRETAERFASLLREFEGPAQ